MNRNLSILREPMKMTTEAMLTCSLLFNEGALFNSSIWAIKKKRNSAGNKFLNTFHWEDISKINKDRIRWIVNANVSSSFAGD